MVVVKVNGNLKINSGVTVKPYYTNYGGPKGFTLFVSGKLTNDGIIDNSHGAKTPGENVYLWKNEDETYEYVPAVGARGGSAKTAYQNVVNGNAGASGNGRQTGGGGTGAGRSWEQSANIGAGGSGTSYSGGAGSGASNSDGGSGWVCTSGAASSTGGGGTVGVVCSNNESGYGQVSMGGVGNPTAGYNYYRTAPINYVYKSGTGGLLIVYARILENNEGAYIRANGQSSSTAILGTTNGRIDTGGSSGGGSINLFYSKITNNGNVTAVGGRVECGFYGNCSGAGGKGTISYKQL